MTSRLALLLLFGLVSLTLGSILILEEGTANEDDWRQLIIELPPAYFDNDGTLHFPKPIWTRREGEELTNFPVLGSLICPADSVQSVAARIGGEWTCVDIDDARLPPTNTTRKRDINERATEGRVDPPFCGAMDSPAMWVEPGSWECGNPEGLIQAVTNPERPECFDTDLVVYNEVEDWFECHALNDITFASTLSTDDFRWQTPSTCRHIGAAVSGGRIRSGQYNNFRWSNYLFPAATDVLARDQTSPPEVINSGGITWVGYTISTTFVQIELFPPFERFTFRPIWPGATAAYFTELENSAGGSRPITGSSLTFIPSVINFNPNGANSVFPVVDTNFEYNAESSNNGYAIVTFDVAPELDAGSYPVIQIAERPSDFTVSSDPNMILVMTMWLQYINPSGF